MKKRLLIGLVAGMAIALMAGTGRAAEGTDMKAGLTEVSPYGDDEKWWNKQFVLSAFTSVQNGDDIENVIALFGEAGLNALECNTPLEYTAEDLSPDNIVRALEACRKNNIRLFITDHERLTGVSAPKEEELKALVKAYAEYPALGGYYVWDEPRGHFDAVKRSFQILQAADPARLPLVAMLPSYGPYKHPRAYPEFVRRFVKEVNPPVLSFDYYALKGKQGRYTVKQGVYQDLALWSSLSIETGKPLWMYVISCAWQSEPSLASLRIQVYTAIAYGAKGIQYFVAKSFTGRKPSFTGAPVNMDGTRSGFYDTFKNFNMEVRAIAPVLMTLKLSRLMHTAPVPPDNDAFVAQWGINAAPDELIVSFHKSTDGKDYLLLVNKNANRARQMDLDVSPGTSLVHIPDMTENKSQNGKIRVALPEGGGGLYEIRRTVKE